MSIEVRNVSKTFGNFKALDNVSLHVAQGELVALLGPSGSGKTTLLRIIAGMETADAGAGSVHFGERDVTTADAGKRGVGFVFQHYALFRHMTVLENVAFGLRVRPWRERPKQEEIRERVEHLLKLVQLEGLSKRYPQQLSGGQRQRVALARALAVEPKVLLLDEPFGALDAKVRRELRRWLRHLHDDVGITSVFVTHDQEEALEVADRIAILNAGKIEQVGTPEEVYEKPVSPFVLQFLGNVNLFHGRTKQYVRPHDVELVLNATTPDSIAAEIEHVAFSGSRVAVILKRKDNGSSLEAEIPRERHLALGLHRGQTVYVDVKEAHTFEGDYSI
jgi:sulfate transport system ATP-binding protein